ILRIVLEERHLLFLAKEFFNIFKNRKILFQKNEADYQWIEFFPDEPYYRLYRDTFTDSLKALEAFDWKIFDKLYSKDGKLYYKSGNQLLNIDLIFSKTGKGGSKEDIL